jgi:hypothetical protein
MQEGPVKEATLDLVLRLGPEGLSPEFASQLVEVFSARERRFSSDDLLELACANDPTFSRRLLSDWPKWGLLALASTTGRGPNGGVGRSWSADQVGVFLLVLRQRALGYTRRSDLANIPVFFFLLLGTEYVPHEQVRRALATWSRAAQNLSAYRSASDSYHAVRRSPRVQQLVEQGSLSKTELLANAKTAPTIADLPGLAGYLGSYRAPNGVGPLGRDEVDEMTRRHKLSLEALLRGMDQLPTATDSLLDAVRTRYRSSKNLDFLPAHDADLAQQAATASSPRFKTEFATACSNALTFLGVVCDERNRPPSELQRLIRSEPIQLLATEFGRRLRAARHIIEELIAPTP